MLRRTFLALATGVAALGLGLGGVSAQELPKLEQKDNYKVGFAQTESQQSLADGPDRQHEGRGREARLPLVYTDAAGSAAKQVSDVNSMIAQHVDLIFLAPREEKPLIPAVMAAKKAGIPVFLLDRNVDQSLAKAGRRLCHLHRLGLQGRRQERRRVAGQGGHGNAKIIELQGTTGSSPANDRKNGFDERSRIIPAWRSWPASPATSPATRAARWPRRCCRRIPRRR